MISINLRHPKQHSQLINQITNHNFPLHSLPHILIKKQCSQVIILSLTIIGPHLLSFIYFLFQIILNYFLFIIIINFFI